MIKRLIAFILRKKLVVLTDMHGDKYIVFERESRSGRKFTYVYDFTKVGHVILNDDGTCGGQSIYIKTWEYF